MNRRIEVESVWVESFWILKCLFKNPLIKKKLFNLFKTIALLGLVVILRCWWTNAGGRCCLDLLTKSWIGIKSWKLTYVELFCGWEVDLNLCKCRFHRKIGILPCSRVSCTYEILRGIAWISSPEFNFISTKKIQKEKLTIVHH